jgi:1,4-dihydroxy-2-naphthoate octaprenyltransferase
MRLGIAAVFGLAALVGLYLVFVGGWPVLAVGAAAILAALAYTGGPFPYGYYGLGELFVFLFFGLAAVVGTYYVQAHRATPAAWLAAVPVGALITAILVVNNHRDRATDARAGKRTLAVLLGPRGTQVEYLLLLAIAYLAAGALAWLRGAGPDGMEARGLWLLLPWLTLPLAYRLRREMQTLEGGALNQTLAGTARLSLLFSLLLALGLLLAQWAAGGGAGVGAA